MALLKASFRGVEFEVTDSELTVGRRNQVFEYPQRDIPYVEDLGRSARAIRLSAFVVGDDYVERMGKLIAALEEEGSGTLIHPWLGQMTVTPKSASTVTYSTALRTASVKLEFVESGEYRFPTSGTDTVTVARAKAQAVQDTAILRFARNFSVSGAQDFVKRAVANDLASVFKGESLKSVAAAFGMSDEVLAVANGALSLVDQKPLAIANTIASAIGLGPYVSTVNSWRKAASQIERLLASDSWSSLGQTYVSGTTKEQIAENSAEIEALIRSVEAANLIGAASLIGTEQDRTDESSSTAVMGYEEMIGARDGILAALDEEMLRADDTDLYLALEAGRLAAWEDMTERAEKSARIVDFKPNAVLPALVIAYDYYGDASREAEIVERNNIRNGGFVPAQTLKLLSE